MICVQSDQQGDMRKEKSSVITIYWYVKKKRVGHRDMSNLPR